MHAGITAPSTYQELDQVLTLTPASTPPVSLFGVYKQALTALLTIDFTACQGSNGNVNANGKKLVAICIANPTASGQDVNIATGGTNGYTLPQPIKVKPGGFAIVYFAGALAGVDGTHKTIDITQASYGSDTPEIGFLFG